MRIRPSTLFALGLLVATGSVSAQLGLPVQLPVAPVLGSVTDPVLGQTGSILDGTTSQVAGALKLARLDRIDQLLRSNRQSLERDSAGEVARRGVLLLVDPDPATVAAVAQLGFVPAEPTALEGLGLTVSEVTLPPGTSLSAAQKLLRKKVPNATVSSDQLFFQSGSTVGRNEAGRGAASGGGVTTPIGLIDGASGQPVTLTKGFAKGAPYPSNHGSAVAGLAQRAGARTVLVADVYGTDPAGGSALAIAQGLGWLIGRGAGVISISLVGPRNPLLERAVGAAQARSVVIVAAVGNDGPAAPPSYPASYNGVLAVTGVDMRNRPLIEAGRAGHLDYAAPGADMVARDRSGRLVAVRGTSFAAPLVAVRAAAALDRGAAASGVRAVLDREAQPLGKRRPDPLTGRGLLCGACR